MALRLAKRASLPVLGAAHQHVPLIPTRLKRYEAFDAQLDKDALEEAREWFKSFDESQLPKGSTTYARSSGPGGQHVNKTETKAVTTYSIREIVSMLPKSLHSSLRSSKYYTASNDSLTFHAQEHRSRNANTDENRAKLLDEVTRIYHANTPAATSEDKKKKHGEIEKKFHESRMKQKKFHGAKKQSRRGPVD